MKSIKSSKLSIIFFLVNACVYISICFYAPFLSSYYSKVGLTAVEIGILLTIGPLVAIVIQPFWAIISDRTGRRKDILSLVVIGSGLSMFTYYIGKSFFTFFIASFLLALFNTSIIPLNDAITLRCAHKNQLDFSRIRMGGTIGYAIVVIIAGAIVKRNPPIQFTLGFLGYMILLLFVRKLPEDEIELSNKAEKSKHFEAKKTGLLHIFESNQVYFMFAFAFISQVGLSFNNSFVGVYMVHLGLNEGKIAIINSIAALSEIPVLFFINKALSKISTMKIIIISCLLLGFRIFMTTGGNIGFLMAAQALNGLTYMTIYFSCAVFISKNVKPENQSKGQSALTIVQTGIGSIVGNIVGGYFVDQFGLKNAYLYMAVLIIAVSAAIAILHFFYQRINKGTCQIN